MATILTSAAIADFRAFIGRRVAYARYYAGGSWRTVNVLEVTTTSAGVVEVEFQINAADIGSATTVTRVQLYSTAGELWADKVESLSLASVAEGYSYVFQFKIEEKEASS